MIKLNVPRDDFSSIVQSRSIAIELTFVTLGHGFKKASSVLFDICAPGTGTFYICKTSGVTVVKVHVFAPNIELVLPFIDLRWGKSYQTTFAGRTTQILRIFFVCLIMTELLC